MINKKADIIFLVGYLADTRIFAEENLEGWHLCDEPMTYRHPNETPQVARGIFCEALLEPDRPGLAVLTQLPCLLEVLWCIKYIKKAKDTGHALLELFDLEDEGDNLKLMNEILVLDTQVLYVDERGVTLDISSLNAGSSDPLIAEWGGTTSFASKAGDIVRKMVNSKDYDHEG